MKKTKILIVEDEIIIADNICNMLKKLGYEVLEPALNFSEAIAIIKNEKPDLAILDINLSGKKTGIDLAKEINNTCKFPFIFLTANADEFTFKNAKEVMPNAFLVKPITEREIFTSIEVALHNFENKDKHNVQDSLFIKDKGKHIKIFFKDILYFKSAHVYVEIILKNKERFLTRKSLNSILEKLNSNFLRVHRSYIVNLKKIRQVNNTFLFIENFEIPIGSKFKEKLIKSIQNI